MFKDWGHYLYVAIPIGSIISMVWVSFEIFTLMASYLDTSYMDAHVIISSVGSCFYSFPYGMSIALTTFVANDMGAGKIKRA